MIVGKPSRASSARRNQRDGVSPIAVGCTGIGVRRSSRNCPFLEVNAGILILNCNDFSLLKKRQKNINVSTIVS
jgi:hypothetical protein